MPDATEIGLLHRNWIFFTRRLKADIVMAISSSNRRNAEAVFKNGAKAPEAATSRFGAIDAEARRIREKSERLKQRRLAGETLVPRFPE